MSLGFVTILLLCQLAGEILSRLLSLPLPGPVLGMVILLAGLIVKGGVPEPLQRTAEGLLSHLSLLFVPAGVGVLLHMSLIAEEWAAISAALVGSTVLTIAVSALMIVWLTRLTGDRPHGDALKDGNAETDDTDSEG